MHYRDGRINIHTTVISILPYLLECSLHLGSQLLGGITAANARCLHLINYLCQNLYCHHHVVSIKSSVIQINMILL